MRRRWMSCSLLALAACGCSWTRFDEVSEDAPVVQLKRPEETSGFGVSLATAAITGRSQVLVGGASGISAAATFELGDGQNPTLDSIDLGACRTGDALCFLGDRTAGLPVATYPGGVPGAGTLCFALGLGETNLNQRGVLFRCDDDTEYAQAAPEPANALIDQAVQGFARAVVTLASDRDGEPAVIVGSHELQRSWFYWPGTINSPISLVPSSATPDESYGTTVAIARVPGARIFAVGAPAEGHVWLYRSSDGATVEPLGCLALSAGFGRALAAGPVVSSANDDLVISDERQVMVLAGTALAQLPASASSECSFGGLPAGGVVASFTCASEHGLESCGRSRFGAALAVGDVDGDGDGEVAVGGPGFSLRGEREAGGVIVFDAEGPNPERRTDVKFLSSGEEGDQLGQAVAMARIGERDVLIAGAPGGKKTAVFYCTSLLTGGAAGPRCQ